MAAVQPRSEIAEMELVIQNTLSEERRLLKEHRQRTLDARRNSNKVLQELKEMEDAHKAELSEVDEEIASLVAAAEGAAESLESHDVTVEQSFKQEEAEATEKKLKQVLDELDLTKKEHEEMDKQAKDMQEQMVDLGDKIRLCKEDAVKAMSNAKQHALERFDEGQKPYEQFWAACLCRNVLNASGLQGLEEELQVAFATAKKHAAAHATGLDQKLDTGKACIPYLGSVDANSSSMVDRASRTDLVVIGGYVAWPLPLCAHDKTDDDDDDDDDVGGDDDYDGMAVAQNLRRFEEASEPWVLPNSLGPAAWLMAYGVAQLFPGCSACPEINGKKGIHYVPGRLDADSSLQVGEAIDHGPILDMFEAPGLGGLVQNNRQVQRFLAALERFSAGEELAPCQGVDIYHKKGMPNDGWLSFYWSDDFLIRFSLAMDFAPYLPGRTRVEAIALAVEAACAALEEPGECAKGNLAGRALIMPV
ncbi:hypothetical protein AK812_SmicGene24021 [Symbiodinium microadriaticum]|uniref:Uncharacterized protein n=1 Tax=Symbiodinium microadriaticum TaxID=2951 RepID=A0A1Q9DFM4_SYMMI|nr:hypothetical protein AK812_SmicGene24021 [Symbiodinium microadriaticum]